MRSENLDKMLEFATTQLGGELCLYSTEVMKDFQDALRRQLVVLVMDLALMTQIVSQDCNAVRLEI
jgi:hypothetical protein